MKVKVKRFFTRLGRRVTRERATTIAAMVPLAMAAAQARGLYVGDAAAASVVGLAVDVFAAGCLTLARD